MKPKELEKYNIFLYLAGHTHGGQFFPLQIPAYFANACFYGLYEDNGRYVYVTPGLGTSECPMRIGSSSVMAVITIEG